MEFFQEMFNLRKRFFIYKFKKLLPFINLKRLKGKYFGLSKEKKNGFEGKFEDFLKRVEKENLIFVKGIYKFFRVEREGDGINVFYKNKKIRFNFPRQKGGENLSISDFIKKNDFICFFVLTSGIGLKEKTKILREEGSFLFSYFLEVLSLEAAEAGALILNQKIGGKRFSFGYPPCPDISEQKKLFEILKPEKIGIKLTENFIMEPESSISGFIIKNPEARYFNLEEK